MKPIDMSPAAVTRRLRQLDELRSLCLTLAGARLVRPGTNLPTLSATSPDVPATNDPESTPHHAPMSTATNPGSLTTKP